MLYDMTWRISREQIRLLEERSKTVTLPIAFDSLNQKLFEFPEVRLVAQQDGFPRFLLTWWFHWLQSEQSPLGEAGNCEWRQMRIQTLCTNPECDFQQARLGTTEGVEGDGEREFEQILWDFIQPTE